MQRHRPRHFVNREGRPRGLVRCKGWSKDVRREGWSIYLGLEGRCRDIGPGTSSIVKVGPWAWSDVKVGLETSDMKIGPDTSDRDSLFSTCTAYGSGAQRPARGPHPARDGSSSGPRCPPGKRLYQI